MNSKKRMVRPAAVTTTKAAWFDEIGAHDEIDNEKRAPSRPSVPGRSSLTVQAFFDLLVVDDPPRS